MLDAKKEFHRLYSVEYGELTELTIRLVGVVLGSVLLYLYSGWLSSFVWAGAYIVAHISNFVYFRVRLENPRPVDCYVAGILFALLLVSFIWMPIMLARDDDPGLSFAGTSLIATTLVFLVHRADTMLWLVWVEIGVLTGGLGCILTTKITHIDNAWGVAGGVLVTLAVAGYMLQAVLTARRTRLEGEAAAERVVQEQKMAAIGRLAGGVAHDFNNALAAIIGNLELYHVLPDQNEKTDVVQEAHAAAKRAEAVVRHLQIYARKAPTRRRKIGVNEVMSQAFDLVVPSLPRRIECQFWPMAQDASIWVDEVQFTTAVINLVHNAKDAIEETGKIEISTERVTLYKPKLMVDGSFLNPGHFAIVRVSDNGSGIETDMIRRVIEPFYSTKPAGSGTGLGLSMVLGFAHSAEGGLDIESVSRRTDVSIFFPISET